MKNFRKLIFLSLMIIMIIIYLFCNYSNEDIDEIIEHNIYVQTNTSIEEKNKIILHITGEVNNPRDYKNR